jgi:hypothetical protein
MRRAYASRREIMLRAQFLSASSSAVACLAARRVLFELVEAALTVASMERLTVVQAELGDDAGLVGSAALARDGVSVIE